MALENLKSPAIYLKILQIILGALALGIVFYHTRYGTSQWMVEMRRKEFHPPLSGFQGIALVLMVASTYMLVVLLMGKIDATGRIYDVLFHVLGCALYIAASAQVILLLKEVESRDLVYAQFAFAATCAVGNCIAYLLNVYVAATTKTVVHPLEHYISVGIRSFH